MALVFAVVCTVASRKCSRGAYGPGGEDYHAVDERARVKDLVQSAQIYARLLTTFAG